MPMLMTEEKKTNSKRLSPPEAARLYDMLSTVNFDRTDVIVDKNMMRFTRRFVRPKYAEQLQGVAKYLEDIGFNQSTGKLSQLVNSVRGTPDRVGFLSPNHPDNSWMYFVKRAVNSLKSVFSEYHLDVRHCETEEELQSLFSSLNKSAGYEYVISGGRKKKDYAGQLLHMQNATISQALDGTYKAQPMVIFDRTQNHGALDAHKKRHINLKIEAKRRAVFAASLRAVLLEIMFSYPLQKIIFHQVDWYAGKYTEVTRALKLRSWSRRFSCANSTDYSGYDASISSWLLREGMEIMRTAFDFRNPEDESLWDVVVHNLIVKDILLPTGEVVRAIKGIPSGSMFTSMIGSVINMIMQLAYMYSIGKEWHVDFEIMVQGDDCITFSNFAINDDHRSLYFKRIFGVTIHPDKCSSDNNKLNPMVYFLCRMYTDDGTVRPLEEIIANMYYPEKWRWYHTDHPERLPEKRRKQYFRAEQENRITTEDEIFWAACLMYPSTMYEIFDVNSFQYYYPKWRINGPAPGSGVSGWMSFLHEYEEIEFTSWDPHHHLR